MIAEAGMFSSAAMFGVLAGVVAAACTVPYVRDTLRGDTVPHRGSWLIWGVLEVVALQAQRADGATWSLVPLMIQALGTCLVLTLSFRFGTGGLGPADLALLALAGARDRGLACGPEARRRHGLRHRSGPDRGHHDGTQGLA